MVRNVDLPDQAVPPQLCRTGSLLPPENKNLSLSNLSLAMLDVVPRSIRIILCFRAGLSFYLQDKRTKLYAGSKHSGKEAQGEDRGCLTKGLGGRPLWKTFLIRSGNSPFFLSFQARISSLTKSAPITFRTFLDLPFS